MLSPIRILTVTVTALGLLLVPGPVQAQARSGGELAQPARKKHHAPAASKAADKSAVPSAAPAESPVAPSKPESLPSEPEAQPDENEEVAPGEDPASCDGCELAVVSLGGTLWGLFGVSRRRGIPRPVIRGLQPR
jgi:hypothetical protein